MQRRWRRRRTAEEDWGADSVDGSRDPTTVSTTPYSRGGGGGQAPLTASTAALGDGDGLFSFPLFSNKFYLLLLSFFPSSDDYLLLLSFFPSSDDGGDDAVRPRRRRRGEAPLPLTSKP